MSVRTDTVNLIVNVNGSKAQNELNELRKRAADLTFEMKNNLKKGTQEFITAAGNLKKVNADMSELKKQIGITSLSQRELNSELNKLKSLKSGVIPLTKEWRDYDAQISKVIARQNELKQSSAGVASLSTGISGLTKNIGLLAAGYLGFTAIITGIKAVISGSIKLSDQLGDLRRVAGLTADESNRLYHSLLQIDTRTSGANLLSIAIIAGKLGVAKDDILSFTQATDKLVVTLGDELGGADEITTQLGKILNVFDGTITGDNISHLGNAIVDLANKGVATGSFIVDFTQRVSGIAKASNLSLAATLGFGAGLEGLGLRSESSSTALQKLILSISKDMPKAAKVAGVPLKEFNALFANSPQDAIIKYAQGLVKNKQAFSEIASSFQDAGEKGARTVQTILAIGQKAEYLHEQIDIASKSIKEQTALNEGFAIKNDNLAGSIEKLGKVFDKLVANNRVQKFLKGIVDVLSGAVAGVNMLIDAFDSLEEQQNKKNKQADKDQLIFADNVVSGMSQKNIEDQQKLADSYKAIYVQSRKDLADFLNSSDKDNAKRHQQLNNQVTQDGRIFSATQKQITKALAEQNKDKTGEGGTPDDPKAEKKRKAEYERLKKEAAAFYKEVLKLKKQAENDSKSDDEKELLNLQDKYEALHAKALEFFKKNAISRKKYTEEEKLIVETFNQELATLQKKQFAKNSDAEYAKSLEDTSGYFEKQQMIAGNSYAAGEIDKAKYSQTLKDIDAQEKAQLVMVAQDYVGTSKKAATDLFKFKVAAEKAETANAITEAENRIAVAKQEALAKAQLDVLKAPEGSKKRQDAEKALAREKFDQDTKDLDKRSQLYLEREAELQAALDQIDSDYKQRKLQAWDDFAQQLLSITSTLFQALDNLDTRQYNKDKALNDAKKNNYKKQLDGKLLSQSQYDKKVAKADEELAKKKHELDMKAFKRQQAMAIIGALINGAMAITSTLAARPGLADIFTLGAARAIQVGLVVAATAAQIAAISSQEPPQAAEGNWFRKGPKHRDKEGGIPVMIERDEAVIKADTMMDRNQYTVTGTPSQITSKLNSMHGGVNWDGGAQLQPKFRERPAQLNTNLPRIMEQGGVVRSIAGSASAEDNSRLLQQLIAKQDELISEVKNQKDRLHAVVSIKEYRSEEKKYDDARKASGLGG